MLRGSPAAPRGYRWARVVHETFEHGSDIGVRGRGATLEAAFAGAALALTSVITDPERVAPNQAVELGCEAGDPELLLVAWLDALIYEMAVRRMLFSRFELRIEDSRLAARAFGEALDIARHQPAVEVKGATLSELAVRRDASGGWLAQCVVDV